MWVRMWIFEEPWSQLGICADTSLHVQCRQSQTTYVAVTICPVHAKCLLSINAP